MARSSVLFASSGLYRLIMLGPQVDYLRDYLLSMVLSGLGVACVFPQLSSVVAQVLPRNRTGVGGAALQAVRQFGGTFGVALTIAFVGTSSGLADRIVAYDRIWWTIIVGGIATSALALPLRATVSAPLEQPVRARPRPEPAV